YHRHLHSFPTTLFRSLEIDARRVLHDDSDVAPDDGVPVVAVVVHAGFAEGPIGCVDAKRVLSPRIVGDPDHRPEHARVSAEWLRSEEPRLNSSHVKIS